jgi:hypothetical protein
MQKERVTQGFVGTLGRCWRQPMLTLTEIAWRWAVGLPALAWAFVAAARIAHGTSLAGTGVETMSISDPMGAAVALSLAAGRLYGPVWAAARVYVPVVAAAWCVAAGVGRAVLLREMTGKAARRTGTVILLQMVRLVALGAAFAVWFGIVHWAARVDVWQPVMAGGEPGLVGYFATVIVASLGLFTLWGVTGWVFFAAPLLAALEGLGPWASLRAAAARKSLRGPMVEVGLVMGIVKLALIVLAMVLSATPLPFETVATPSFLHGWYAVVTVLYLAANDLFHVARVRAFVEQMVLGD